MSNKKEKMSENAVPAEQQGRRRRSVMKAQKRTIIILSVCIVLLIAGLLVAKYFAEIYTFVDEDGTKYDIKRKGGVYVLCDKDGYTLETVDEDKYYKTELGTLVSVNAETGDAEIFAVVDTDDGEYLGTNSRLLMFKHTSQDNVQQIEVHNQYGAFTFYRNESDKFVLKNNEAIQYSQTLFSSLVVSCGYPLTMQRIQDPIRDADGGYTEYGLSDEVRKDADGNDYNYTPIWYRLTDTSGNAYTVYVGDAIPSGAGYYVRLVGRDAVYIMNYSVESSVLNMYGDSNLDSVDNVLDIPVETYVTPIVCYPMSMNNYFEVSNFMLFKGKENVAKITTDSGDSPDQEATNPFISFTYWDMDERAGTINANDAYILNYPKGYYPDDTAIDDTLQSFYGMTFLGVKKLNYTDEDLKTYGLDEPEYLIFFNFNDLNHLIFISAMTDRGTYYMTSAIYDIIVEVDRSQLRFLDYELVDWVDSSYFQLNLAWATKMTVEAGGKTFTFYLDNSESDSMTNPNPSAKTIENGTITSEMLKIKCVDSDGNVMQSLSKVIVKDTAGFTWTIDDKNVKAVDAAGNSATIKNLRYAYNALGTAVTVLEDGKGIDCGNGLVISVSANWITVNDNGVSTKYLRYGCNVFRKFFQSLLYASIEGDVYSGDYALTEDRVEELLKTADDKLQAKITIETSHEGTEYVFRYYPYSERRSLLTVNGGDGEFYVLRSFTDKVIADAARVIAGEAVDPTSKY